MNFQDACNGGGEFLPWIDALKKKSGSYVIRNGLTRRILYVGESHTGQLAKTIKRHFYPWKDSFHTHHVYDRHMVEIGVQLAEASAAVELQNHLIAHLEPRDNEIIPVDPW